MKQTGNLLGVSIWSVNNAMRRHFLPRRPSHITNSINFHNSPLSFKPKIKMTQTEKFLKISGLMLYWGEGSKAGKCVVDFANSDEIMVKIFLKMLREIYGITESKLRIFLYCYSNQNPNQLIKHWSNILKIPISQFSKPYIRYDHNPNKTGKMEFGLVHIRYADTRLMEQIKKDIGKIASKLC
jgi:hypothetical protein